MSILQQHRAGRQGVTPDPTPPITAAELAEAIGADATRAGHLLAAVWALAFRFAPGAPDAIKREAVIRAAGWLSEASATGARSESVGDISTSYSPAMTGCLRASGAMALLSAWKVRRAGVI